MRLLIAGGGTGGHIYPALAVADSLRRRPNPPDLGWIGGHRGLEDRIVRAAGIPLRRLALRSLRTVDRDVHLVADPARLALSVPQALALLARDRPAAIFTTGGYVAIPVLIAASVLRIPVLLWEGNVTPGPERPGDRRPRLGDRGLVRHDLRGAGGRAGRAWRRARPSARPAASTGSRRARASASRPAAASSSSSAARRPSAGSTPPWPRSCPASWSGSTSST